MSQRETEVKSDLQQWRGVDQRTQPTLVKSGFFVSAQGIYFGLGDNAERITGKKLAGYIPFSIFEIFQFENLILIQTYNKLFVTTLQELTSFTIPHYNPSPPTDLEENMSQALLEYHAAAGGTLGVTSGGWTTMGLNTTVSDPNGIVTALTSNKITLPAGTYRLKAYISMFASDRSKIRLYNVTDSSEIRRGMNTVGSNSGSGTGFSMLQARFTLAGSKDIAIQYDVTSTVSEGQLAYAPYPGTEGTETGLQVEILKEP